MKYICFVCNSELDKHLDEKTSMSIFTSYKKCKICYKIKCLNCPDNSRCINTVSIVKKDQSGEGGCSTSDKAFNICFYKNHSFENGNAPWGKTEGGEIIGLEVPLLSNFNWGSCSDTSSDDGLHIQGCEVENDLVLTICNCIKPCNCIQNDITEDHDNHNYLVISE